MTKRKNWEKEDWVYLAVGLIIIALSLFVVVIGQSVRSDRLKEQISECQNQSPTKLEYRYNFTRCVFEGEGKTIVCNLVMRNSCLEIKNIDENCEVLE